MMPSSPLGFPNCRTRRRRTVFVTPHLNDNYGVILSLDNYGVN
jgi:hypothetical protein